MGEAAAVVGIVCGSRGSWLWSRPEANRRQAEWDERRRGEFFDVLVQQADEARTRVREGSTWQGMPLLGAFSFAAQKMPSRRKALRCGGEGKEQQQKHFGTPTKASTGECYRTGGRAAPCTVPFDEGFV